MTEDAFEVGVGSRATNGSLCAGVDDAACSDCGGAGYVEGRTRWESGICESCQGAAQ